MIHYEISKLYCNTNNPSSTNNNAAITSKAKAVKNIKLLNRGEDDDGSNTCNISNLDSVDTYLANIGLGAAKKKQKTIVRMSPLTD